MSGREKVLKGLECCWQPEGERTLRCHCTDCPYGEMNDIFGQICRATLNRDALALLKEQGEKIATMRMVYGSDVNVVGEIVRCKDCIYWDKGHTEECDNSDSVCYHNGWCKPDWYCGDGERRKIE